MKLEVGMYVRTEYGHIGKIIDLSKSIVFRPVTYKEDLEEIKTEEISVMVDTNYNFDDENDSYFLEDIIKASYNIIDLIEEGDYVNGYKVIFIDDKAKILRVDGFCWGTNIIEDVDIKSIITREQIENMQYKVD